MSMLRRFARAIVCYIWRFCLGLLLLASAAGAETASYSILLDTDHNPETGCTVATVAGDFTGVEQRLVTTVTFDTNTAKVSGVQLQNCANSTNSTFDTVAWSDPGGWPVGLGNGTSGAAVIETWLPLSALNGAGPLRLGVISQAGAARDALLTDSAGGVIEQPLPSVPPVSPATAIPALNPLILALLIVLLGGALHYGRQYPGAVKLLALVVVVAGAGLAWAAYDGQTTDWQGSNPLATDPKGDAANPVDLIALFGRAEGSALNFRIDAVITLNQPPQVTASGPTSVTLPDTASLSGTVSDDGLPNPPGQLTLTWSKISGPGTVSFSNAHPPSTAPGATATFSAPGAYVLRLTADDGGQTASADVAITVNPANAGNHPPSTSPCK